MIISQVSYRTNGPLVCKPHIIFSQNDNTKCIIFISGCNAFYNCATYHLIYIIMYLSYITRIDVKYIIVIQFLQILYHIRIFQYHF